MIQIPVVNIPNQTLSIQLDGNLYDISIHATQDNEDGTTGIMAVDISINNSLIISGVRAVSNFLLIPYQYLVNGNFGFVTSNDDYPDWRKFGISQYLVYISNDELEEIANGNFQS